MDSLKDVEKFREYWMSLDENELKVLANDIQKELRIKVMFRKKKELAKRKMELQQITEQLVECHKCKQVHPIKQMFKGKIIDPNNKPAKKLIDIYECVDEINCRKICKKLAEEISEIYMKERREKEAKEQEFRDKYGHLSCEEQFEKKFPSVKFSNLKEFPVKFRDASIHYYDEENDSIYSWNHLRGFWYVINKDFTKNEIKCLNGL